METITADGAYYAAATVRRHVSSLICQYIHIPQFPPAEFEEAVSAMGAKLLVIPGEISPTAEELRAAGHTAYKAALAAGYAEAEQRCRDRLDAMLTDAGIIPRELPPIALYERYLPELPAGAADAWPLAETIRSVLLARDPDLHA